LNRTGSPAFSQAKTQAGNDQNSGQYSDGGYLRSHKNWHVKDSPWKARQVEKLMARNHLSPATVAEVGCGAGEILRQLSLGTSGTEYFGYEVSPQAFEICRTRANERLHYFLKNLLEVDAHYDCLLCMDVFEHVDDYLGFVRKLRDKADYKIFHIPLDLSAVSVMRGNMMAMRKAYGHLHYFSQETARATLEDCGYRILDGFLTPWAAELTGLSGKQRLVRPLRKAVFKASPECSARLLGGCSYLVLAQ
jgi:Methyltransferase domain